MGLIMRYSSSVNDETYNTPFDWNAPTIIVQVHRYSLDYITYSSFNPIAI